MELPEFHVRLALDEADLSSPAGRDRALDEVVPVLAAMRESISRDELARLVADRLDADPGLVMRRVSGGGPARPGARGRRAAEARWGWAGGRAGCAATAAERARAARAGAAGDVHRLAGEGRELLERLTAEHLSSPAVARARDWLAEHLEEPMRGLPREDEELVSLITQLVMRAEREPGGREAMELNLLQLEQALLEGRIQAASGGGRGPAGGASAPPRRARGADRALGDGERRAEAPVTAS